MLVLGRVDHGDKSGVKVIKMMSLILAKGSSDMEYQKDYRLCAIVVWNCSQYCTDIRSPWDIHLQMFNFPLLRLVAGV